MASDLRSWRQAWLQSAYGPGGHWTTQIPSAHFQTAATTPEFAAAVADLLRQSPEITTVVEFGAGDGALLNALAQALPNLVLHGVDIRDRPAGLASGVGWATDLWDVRSAAWSGGAAARLLATSDAPTLVLAVEWLDDLPCVVADRDERGCIWETEVDAAGRESTGRPLPDDEARWAEAWWPHGSRIEVGSSRDAAWAAAMSVLRRRGGLGLMVDYGHVRADRPTIGSLVGYRGGRLVPAVPDSLRNLTAHVAVDAVRAAGERAGATTLRQARLAEIVPTAPVTGATPLATLAARSRHAALLSRRGWGDHIWLLQQVPAGRPVG
jgi:hypothetical protein